VLYVGVAKLSGTDQLTSEATWSALTVADTESTRIWTTTGDDTELDDRQLRLIPHDAKGLQIATMVQVLADPVVGKALLTRRTTSWAMAADSRYRAVLLAPALPKCSNLGVSRTEIDLALDRLLSGPWVLAVIATLLVRGCCRCGSLMDGS
jgi:hypothetical protein